MESLLYHVISILKNPAFVLGIIAFIGLLSLKRSFSDCIKGTVKTILGFTEIIGDENGISSIHVFDEEQKVSKKES